MNTERFPPTPNELNPKKQLHEHTERFPPTPNELDPCRYYPIPG